MIAFLADENFDGRIVVGLLRRLPALDLVRAQDVGISGADDPTILTWAAEHERIVLSHDVNTLTKYAYERAADGHRMPGVFEVSREIGIGPAIEELILVAECSLDGEYEGQVRYIPL